MGYLKLPFSNLFQVPVAILPNTQMQYFDVVTKTWKLLPSMAQANEQNQECFCAEYVRNYLYVAGKNQFNHFVIYRYDLANNSWETLPPFLKSSHQIHCLCSVDDYIYAISESNLPQRYSLANNNWQSRANFTRSDRDKLCTVAAAVLKSKIYVIHGYMRNEREGRYDHWVTKPAVVHCFDPEKNEWQQKASTCHPHFGSSLFVVNNRLYVAWGKLSWDVGPPFGTLQASSLAMPIGYKPAPAPRLVEVYNEENNTWSVIEQKHIPPNDLGAVEIEGRVYFIINKFPVDSGIRISPGENNHVLLNEWEKISKVSREAAICYLPVKRENLKIEKGESN